MAFSTGSAASWAALVSAMDTFLTGDLRFSNTYTNGVNDNDGGLFDAATWSYGSAYWNFDFRHASDQLRCWLSTDNDGGGTTFGQHTGTAMGSSGSENSDSTKNNYVTFPLTYYFYGDEGLTGDNDYFCMVLNPSPGLYHHFWIGVIEPYWAAALPYGAYCGASTMTNGDCTAPMAYTANSTIGKDVLHYPYSATPSGEQTSIQNTHGSRLSAGFCGAAGWNEQGARSPMFEMVRTGQSDLTGRSILAPNPALVTDASTESNGTRSVLVGSYPGVHMMSIQGLPAEAQITIGSDTYDVYPMARRGTETQGSPFTPGGSESGGTFQTGMLAFAYKRFA